MDVEVRLFASFRKSRWNCKRLTMDEESTVKKIIEQLDIKEEELGIVLVNGVYSGVNTILNNDDVLAIFPPIGGG